MLRSPLVALLVVVLAGWEAEAQVQLVSGRRLVMVQTSSGTQRLVFLSREAALAPTPGGADDPTIAGGLLVVASGSGESVTFDLPAASWAVNASGTVYSYRNALAPGGPSAVKVARVKNGKLLKVTAKSTGISLNEASQGTINLSLALGTRQYCASFGGTVLRDEPNRFIAKSAPPPVGCPGGGPTTTSTSVTSTTVTSTTSTLVPACPPPANPLGAAAFTIQGGTTDCGGAGFNTPAVAPFTGGIYDADGVLMENLGLGCFYAGGGLGNALPASSLPFNSKAVLSVGTVNGLALGLTASDGTGPLDCSRGAGPAKRCYDGSPGTDTLGACETDADCGNGNGTNICLPIGNCFFGAPIPLRPITPTLATCVMQAILTDACGAINLDDLTASLTVALGARLYLTQNPVSPCPGCEGGVCTDGQRAGLPCSGGFGAENTTVECPPSDSKFIGELLVNPLSVTSGTTDMVSDENGYFCPGQVHRGALGTGVRARRIQQVGNLLVPGGPNLYTAQLGGNLCAPRSGADLVDGVVDLPGPSTASVAGSIEVCLLPDLCNTVCNPCTLGPLCDIVCNPCLLCIP